MKKYLLSFAVMMMGSALLTGCLSDNDSDSGSGDQTVIVTEGALVVNNGSSYNGINGSLTYIDYKNDASREININLGGTPNDVMVYGGKVYVTGSDENTVFVLDRKNFSLIKQISTVSEMGAEEGAMPRALEAWGSNVYVSTYGGYVGVIDTLKLSIGNMYPVGSYPEGMAVSESEDGVPFLYVANSDYGNGNGSISTINLTSGSVSEFKNEKIKNPQKIAAGGGLLYVLDWGGYDENWNQTGAGVYVVSGSNVQQLIPDATGMAAGGYNILTFNAPYGSTTTTYSIYNALYGSVSSFHLSGDTSSPIFSPAAISIDPNTGNVLIASRPKDPDTGYPSYAMPGYVNVYKSNGEFYKSYPVGVEPHAFAFTYTTAKYSDYIK